ncbi:hypothetical protein FA10DRAFT_283636 [Acaromyces ingoldii]|uniref:Uncharacterized protein n=1 Tax=Acaromyces ingoldii TaxID=215250 RepID=A0A316YY88_9BASI|nr:hypothetical protein FA10DRAFT_283636 [Acaromyces ingoldii]PWN94026.1 hypothetical protein FA10DRAFT_283636 [Acaromyces ingoldii]
MDPGFLNKPRGHPSSSAAAPRASRPQPNFLQRFWRDEIANPEKRAGNQAVAWGVSFFVAGIVFARTIAKDVIVPAL